MRDGLSPEPIFFDPAAPGSIENAAEMIMNGGVVAIPTDTVYGIAASIAHPEAIERLFAIKQRDQSKPIPILVSSTDGLRHITQDLDPDIALLLDEYWPGPLTIAIPAPRTIPAALLAADGTVGVRMPNHRLAIELIERAGGIVACTSANVSGDKPALSAAEVIQSLGSSIDGVVRGGVSPTGLPSTVISVRDGSIVIHREGAIPIEHILATWSGFHSN